MEQYLMDSNAVIDYLSGKIPNEGMLFLNKIINDIPTISVITKIEVLGFNTNENAEHLLLDFMNDSIILGLSDNIVEKTIELRKDFKIKLPDAIIAATALENKLILITRNLKDFDKIHELDAINPHDF